jgi:hypothetical protein
MADAPTVDAAAPFDLATYIDRYPAGSETRLQRLLFIANKDTEVAAQALQLVERHFRETNNVRGYKHVFGGGDKRPGGIVYDSVWVQDTEELTQSALETLEARLSASQAQLQKEAIRTAYLAIGEFLREKGDLPAAMRAIMRSREYCTTRAQTAHICLVIIEMAMNMSKLDLFLERSSVGKSSFFESAMRMARVGKNLTIMSNHLFPCRELSTSARLCCKGGTFHSSRRYGISTQTQGGFWNCIFGGGEI